MSSLCDGRYKIEKTIGHGGFGTIYKALDTKVEVAVAIKEISYRTESERQGVVREAKMAAGFFDLDGIATARDFFEEDGKAYIVTEYVKGISISQYIAEKGRIPGADALKMVRPIIESLAKVHKRGIIHRDISADNVMITGDGKLKLIDFGAAKSLEKAQNGNNTVVFKRGYAPVEQYRENAKQGTWTDVYSLCATIYYMVSGIIPEDALERVFNDKLIDLEKVQGIGLSSNQKKTIMAGMRLEPEERLQTMEALYESLYNQIPTDCEYPEIYTTKTETNLPEGKQSTEELRAEIDSFFGEKKRKGGAGKIVVGILGIVLLLGIIYVIFGRGNANYSGDSIPRAVVTAVPQPSEESETVASIAPTETPRATEKPAKKITKPRATKKPKKAEKTKARVKKKREVSVATAAPKVTRETPKPRVNSKKRDNVRLDGSL
ncbi:serine/threonine protein kinase [Eubacterium xylanophilum]|uniref:serine/threonine protein kinase n=1 Tax=Eubacterium xylanophilum TaxID=39497 RepID=UPI000479ABB1|nr:serine/threonine-protein kinase [Eubacterium xylanophilum]